MTYSDCSRSSLRHGILPKFELQLVDTHTETSNSLSLKFKPYLTTEDLILRWRLLEEYLNPSYVSLTSQSSARSVSLTLLTMSPKPSPPSATEASPSFVDSTAPSRGHPTRPHSRTLVAAKESSLSFSVPRTGEKALTARRQRLAKEMAWWQLKVDDWFNTYLPGEDLPDNLQWTPFNVDITSEPTMYAGLVSHWNTWVRFHITYVLRYNSKRACRT